MNIQQLRKSLKVQWLNYYRENREWLTRVGVWVTCEGERRPSSSFILATLSVLEPQLTQLLPLIVDLSSNPDRIVIALGLNFNPDEELKAVDASAQSMVNGQVKMLPSGSRIVNFSAQTTVAPQPVVVKQPEPVSSAPVDEAAHRNPDVRQSVRQNVHQNTESMNSPFEAPIDLVEESAETWTARSSTNAIPSTSPTSETITRPVMDTVELATGELPKREQANAVDETCEGRKKSAVKTRQD